MRTFDAAETNARLPSAALVDALRAMAVEGCVVPPRQTHAVAGIDGAPAGHVLLMPAWRAGGRLGVKVVNVFAGNVQRALPSLHAVYLLFDAGTGVPLAQIDGAQLTARRTAAVSALAASHLARADATRLVLVGAGRVAALLPEAMAAVRGIGHVDVWNHHIEGAHALVQRLRAQGFAAEVAADLRAAVQRAHIVSCATLATQPLICGEWLPAGVHVDLIGAFTPQMREADAACVARSRVYVDHDEALAKAGDLVQAAAEGQFSAAALQGTLEQLCRGSRRGRTRDDEVTLFKSVGSAWQDLAAAELVFNSAG
jgi:ornithine cyclodeaminase